MFMVQAVIHELDGLKKNVLLGHAATCAVRLLESIQQHASGIWKGQRKREVMMQPEAILAKALAALQSQQDKGLWGMLQRGQHRQQLQQWLSSGLHGDNGILDCLQYFSDQGYGVSLCTCDRVLRIRAGVENVPAGDIGKFHALLRQGRFCL